MITTGLQPLCSAMYFSTYDTMSVAVVLKLPVIIWYFSVLLAYSFFMPSNSSQVRPFFISIFSSKVHESASYSFRARLFVMSSTGSCSRLKYKTVSPLSRNLSVRLIAKVVLPNEDAPPNAAKPG